MRAFLPTCERLRSGPATDRMCSNAPRAALKARIARSSRPEEAGVAQGHALGRIAVLPSGRRGDKGERLGEEESVTHLKGEPGTGIVSDTEPEVESEAEAVTASKGEKKPKVKKAELAAPTAGDCGEYSWQVQFSVSNAKATTTGYIVQKVNAVYKRKDCLGADKPVTGIGTFPFWEAWGVRGGKVFIGDTASAHNADTYSDPSMGDSTKGSITVRGTAEFFPDITLPAHMKADNPDTQAGSLRSSLTDPSLSGATGSIPHSLTASWNCCGAARKKTVLSNKK